MPDHGRFHCVYLISNAPTNQASVGVTRNSFETRINQRRSRNNRTRSKIIATLNDTCFEQLTDHKLSSNDVRQAETNWVEHFVREGWDVLNVKSAIGSTGTSKVFWTKEKCREAAGRFTTRHQFRKQAPRAYNAPCKKGCWKKSLKTKCLKQPQKAIGQKRRF